MEMRRRQKNTEKGEENREERIREERDNQNSEVVSRGGAKRKRKKVEMAVRKPSKKLHKVRIWWNTYTSATNLKVWHLFLTKLLLK